VKDICVWLVVASASFFGSCYVFKIWKKKAVPTISTWIIFLVGCGLSFVTYIAAENRDIKSGILNTIDLVYVSMVILAIILWGKHKVRFEPHEKWYLAGAAGIVAYGFATGDVWSSNVLTQVLMSAAYFPMYHKMIIGKKKTDSYFAWIPAVFNASIALYPAIYDGNTLAVIYAVRAFTFSLATSLMMAYYQFVKPKT
jgi:hypothetical protein